MMGLQKKVSQLRQVDHFVGVIIPLDDEHCLGENNCGVRPYTFMCVCEKAEEKSGTLNSNFQAGNSTRIA